MNGKLLLTPVVIAAGRHLAERRFGGKPDAHLHYSCVPSVVFSRPPIGGVGLSEREPRTVVIDHTPANEFVTAV